MGFPPAEVAAGVEAVLAAHGHTAAVDVQQERRVYQLGELRVTVEPLPSGRSAHALFHPRTLLVVEGEGPLADAVKAAIRLKFLRVTG
jgi:hypothetical protein